MAQTADLKPSDIFRFPPVVTIREISEVRDAVLPWLEKRSPFALDCSAIDRADVSLLQLLISAQQMAKRDRTVLHLIIPAEGLVEDLIRLSGLAAHFDRTGAVDE
jgi:ABC-type transporter Mla MlaB component